MFNRSSDTVPDHVRFFCFLIADYGRDGKHIAFSLPEKIQTPSEQCLPLDEGKKESAFDQNPVIAESPDHFAVKDAEQEGGKDTADQDSGCCRKQEYDHGKDDFHRVECRLFRIRKQQENQICNLFCRDSVKQQAQKCFRNQQIQQSAVLFQDAQGLYEDAPFEAQTVPFHLM